MYRHQKLMILAMFALIIALVVSMGFSHVALAKHGGGPSGQGISGSMGNPGAWGSLRPGGPADVSGQPWSSPSGGRR
jgi:hypothetical protein